MARTNFSAPAVAVGAVTALFAAICAAFVRQDGLGTFADDSVSYLIMAQVFSPWQSASVPVMDAFAREAFYPPFFPLLLALAGAAHDIERAHVLNALLVAAILPFAYGLAARWLGDRLAALAAAAAIALLPALWIQAFGILSEPLFCVLLLAVMWAVDAPLRDGPKLALAGALLAALVLTRTAGIPVAVALVAWSLVRGGDAWRARLVAAAPGLIALVAYLGWVALRPADVVDTNALMAAERVRAIGASAQPWAVVAAGVARQMQAMADAWAGAILLFWVEGQPARPWAAAAIGLLALFGMAQRCLAGKADAWMVVAYLVLYLLWPFYDQMARFIFPVVPVLVLYAFGVVATVARRVDRSTVASFVLALALLALAAPGLAFIQQRAQTTEPHARIVDWYRTPDLDAASERSVVHLGLAADMEVIRARTRPEERVMWVAPAYLALLADRRGVPAPDSRLTPQAYRAAVAAQAPDVVFLSVYHPRDTIRDDAWRVASTALDGAGQVIHERRRPGGEPFSRLIRLRR